MMIQAVLGNPHHPEYGVATIPFPIPRDQYAHCMELLEALEIGDAIKVDCKVEEVDSFFSVLKRTEMLTVNVEELNYLAKRLDSFDTGEAAQFQAVAHKLELFELKDLINLTFCCQQATVITDFSDLAAVGRNHYMNLHGGCAKTEELNALDGEETARRLIENGGGTITPYGVVYDNGMKLEPVYDGRFFPCYYYEPNAITVAVTSKAEPEDTEHITWLFLPMVQEEIDRALLRGGITDPADVRLRLEDSQLPNEVDVLLDSLIRQITAAMETELIPFPGGTMSLGDIECRLRVLEQQFQTLLEKATDDPAAYGGQFKEILDEQTFLKEKRSVILANNNEQTKANQRIMDAAQTLENASPYITEWDESAVRQLVETVKILSKDEVAVTLKGGIEICQKIMH